MKMLFGFLSLCCWLMVAVGFSLPTRKPELHPTTPEEVWYWFAGAVVLAVLAVATKR